LQNLTLKPPVSGKVGDDVKHYQEKEVAVALDAVKK